MKKYYIYFIIIIIAYNTGLIMFPAPLSFAIDLLNFYLLYLCFRHYQEVPKVAKPLVVFWSIFTTYLLIKIFMSENSNTTKDLFKNFRNVYPYFMFFYLAMLVLPATVSGQLLERHLAPDLAPDWLPGLVGQGPMAPRRCAARPARA